MSNSPEFASVNKIARMAGWLYIALVPLGFFGMFASSGIVVPGDAAATTAHILAKESLFRLSIASAFLVQLVNVLVVLALYRVLKPVSPTMAALMVIFLLLGVPIAMLNELNHFAILAVLRSDPAGPLFTAAQQQALVPLFLDLHNLGVNIAGIFWGLWLFPMGYLVFKSGFLPKILGVLLIVGCIGYLVESFAAFLFPSFSLNVALFTFWGEVLFPLWLVIKGVNVERWTTRALAAT